MKTKAVLFDMDGVLVDVSNSYRLVVKKTVNHFLNREISLDTIQNRGCIKKRLGPYRKYSPRLWTESG